MFASYSIHTVQYSHCTVFTLYYVHSAHTLFSLYNLHTVLCSHCTCSQCTMFTMYILYSHCSRFALYKVLTVLCSHCTMCTCTMFTLYYVDRITLFIQCSPVHKMFALYNVHPVQHTVNVHLYNVHTLLWSMFTLYIQCSPVHTMFALSSTIQCYVVTCNGLS